MSKTLPRFGYRIVGDLSKRRWLIDASAAFGAYAACDPKAETAREAYLSAFWFGADFRDHLVQTGSTKGFEGPCWAPFIWFDIDDEDDLQAALDGARRLARRLFSSPMRRPVAVRPWRTGCRS